MKEMMLSKFGDMTKQQVWKKGAKNLMFPNCRFIKNKCVFKIKCNDVHPVTLIACGYSHIPGVTSSKNYLLQPSSDHIMMHGKMKKIQIPTHHLCKI